MMSDLPPPSTSNTGEPNWNGLLKWSAKYSNQEQSEGGGAQPDSEAQGGTRKKVTPEDAHWFEQAMRANTVDQVGRMKEIASAITLSDTPEGMSDDDLLEVKVALLEELQDLVEHIDNATDLKVIGGFDALMQLLKVGTHPRLSAAAAEVVATSVQNNPKAQQWALAGGALTTLLELLDNAVTKKELSVTLKSILAISSLIRNFEPARIVFRTQNGYQALTHAVTTMDEAKVAQKVAGTFAALAEEMLDLDELALMTSPPLLKTMLARLDSEELIVREAVLRFLVATFEAHKGNVKISETQPLTQIVARRHAAVSLLKGEEAEAKEDELGHLNALLEMLKR